MTETVRVPVKACCREVLAGEDCGCEELAAQMDRAPLLRIKEGVVMGARSWTVTIPAPGPWLNANGRRDRRRLAGVVKAWRDAAHQHAKASKLPALGKVHIVAHLRFTDRRARDVHNYFPTVKAAVDGLVDYGLIPDDRDAHLIGPDLRPGDPLPRKPYGPAGVLVLTIREASPRESPAGRCDVSPASGGGAQEMMP